MEKVAVAVAAAVKNLRDLRETYSVKSARNIIREIREICEKIFCNLAFYKPINYILS